MDLSIPIRTTISPMLAWINRKDSVSTQKWLRMSSILNTNGYIPKDFSIQMKVAIIINPHSS